MRENYLLSYEKVLEKDIVFLFSFPQSNNFITLINIIEVKVFLFKLTNFQ